MNTRAGIHFGTSWARLLAAVKCSPPNAASDAAMNTEPKATILARTPEDSVSRSRRYIQMPASRNPSPSADGQKVAGEITCPRKLRMNVTRLAYGWKTISKLAPGSDGAFEQRSRRRTDASFSGRPRSMLSFGLMSSLVRVPHIRAGFTKRQNPNL
jgi:hypothetical protein